MINYLEELKEWENSFICTNCDGVTSEDFVYVETVSNGEVWTCKHCGEDTMVDEMPKEGF